MKIERRFFSIALLLVLAALGAQPALAAVGRVQFVTGEVQMRRTGVLNPLERGAAVDVGDVILTGTVGRAQLRFTDGGLVSLYPESHFTVARYVDSGDATQDSFAVGLLQGSMRAITGLIGKRNPANYKVTTPTAVVGIRGSSFHIYFNAQGELEVAGEQDEIEVCTQAGCVGVTAGESVRVISEGQLPVYTNTQAMLPLVQPQMSYAAGDQIGFDGSREAVLVTRPLPVDPYVPPGQPNNPYFPPTPTPTPTPTPGIPFTPITPVRPVTPIVPIIPRPPGGPTVPVIPTVP